MAKQTREERMIENINVFDFELNVDDMAGITTVGTNATSFFNHRDLE